ncbi:MAG: AI-2E family transporter [Candidatus Saccharibacteria bacterium]|nr:AI-2E family transporter [Candidatus Saccharibacteria bacterium]
MSTTTKVQIDTKTFIRFWLVIIGFAAAGYILVKASAGLLIIGCALFFALAIKPLVNRIASIIPSKSRNLPIALAYILVVGFICGFIAIVVPTIISETAKFASNLPNIIDGATSNLTFIDDIGESLHIANFREQAIKAVGDFSQSFVKLDNVGSALTNSITAVGSGLATIILALVLAFFMLTEGPQITKKFWSRFNKSGPAKKAEHVISRLSQTISTYVSSAITVAVINAGATMIAVFIISPIFGLNPGLALPFGLITGVFSLIPMFGSFIGGALVALLLGFSQLGAGVTFIIYTIVYLQIESNVISPKVQGKGMNLPALAILSAVTVGVYTFGLIGAIVSIPIAGCIRVLIEEYSSDFMDDGKLNGSDLKKPTKPAPKTEKNEKTDVKLIAEA